MFSFVSPVLATIGYEGASIEEFITTLSDAKVTRLIDVRQLAISRRRGFAKTALSATLAAAGIRYIHLRSLGDPKEGRDAARKNNLALFEQIFRAHILTPNAQKELHLAANFAEEEGACLMCYERNHSACHRTIVAQSISDLRSVRIRHLDVARGFPSSGHSNKSLMIAECA